MALSTLDGVDRRQKSSAKFRGTKRCEGSMRLCRFNDNRLGLVVEDHVFDVSDVLDPLPQYRYPYHASIRL